MRANGVRLLIVALLVADLPPLVAAVPQAALQPATTSRREPTAVVVTSAPIYLMPDATREPLRVAKEGSTLRLVDKSGEWCTVQFQDPQFGLRTGYIQTRFVLLVSPKTEPVDLSVPVDSPPAAAPAAPPRPTPAPPSRIAPPSPISVTASTARRFSDARLLVPQSDGKGHEQEGALISDPAAKVLRFDAEGHPVVEIPYSSIKSLLYERSAKPRYATGLLVAWPLLFTKSKKHFLTMQYTDSSGQGKFEIVRLDKGNVTTALAALQADTGVRIERTEER